MARVSDQYILERFPEALARGWIRPYFQPIYRSFTDRICCLEALARWQDPEHGLLSPADFIPLLEKEGLICDLDMEILRQVCAFHAEMTRQGLPVHSISVNISRHDFRRDDLFDRVSACLSEFGVPPDAIKLEITESIMLEDIEAFQRIFTQFHDAGFSIWIDDFGSAYSSLNVLQNYQFDTMKFDMLFLRNFSEKGKQVLASLINMAKILNIHTLVEGVETAEQRDFLRSVGCEALQGFYYSRPLPAGELISLLRKEKSSAEDDRDIRYWNRIGRLNVLSPSPLQDFGRTGSDGCLPDIRPEKDMAPLALAECSRDRMTYIYVNEEYQRKVRELGFESVEVLEQAFNEKRSDQYLLLKNTVLDAISKGTVQKLDYTSNGIFYTLKARCLAREEDRAMLAMQLQIFDSEQEIKNARELLQYGNALFSTYEIVTLVYPRRGASTRIYAANLLPAYDNLKASSLRESVQNFCESEIIPADQERYMRFFDLDTLDKRIGDSRGGFVQEAFRLRREKNPETSWRSIRISRVPSEEEPVYIYTIQVVNPKEARMLEIMSLEYPDLLFGR